MNGLLNLNFLDPVTQGLLTAGSSMLSAAGPSRVPTSAGSAIGQGLLSGMQGYRTAQQANMQDVMLQIQMKKLKNDLEAQTAFTNMYGGAGGASAGGVGPSLADIGRLMAIDPERGKAALQLWQAKNPNLDFSGGIPKDPRTGLPIDGVPNVPQTNQQGFSTTPRWNPATQGYEVTVTPGGIEAFRAQQGAAEAERARFDLAPLPATSPNTPPLDMSRLQRLERAGAFRPSGPVNPGIEQKVDAELKEFGRVSAATADLANQAGITIRPELVYGARGAAAGMSPADQRSADAAAAAEKAFAEAKAKEAVEASAKFRDAYFQSQSMLGNLNILESVFSDPNVASGAAAETISGLKGVADSFGINIAGKGYEDVAMAIGGEMSLRMRTQGGTNLMPGAMSNFEVGMLKAMSPGLAQSREGRMLLTQVFKAKAERDAALGELAANYEDQHGKLDAGFYKQAREFVKTNPMFSRERIDAITELAKRLARGRR